MRALADYEHSVELGLSVCFRQGWPVVAHSSRRRGAGVVGTIVFGSDQGLVGQFNEAVAEFVEQTLATLPGEKKIWAVGERIYARFTKLHSGMGEMSENFKYLWLVLYCKFANSWCWPSSQAKVGDEPKLKIKQCQCKV